MFGKLQGAAQSFIGIMARKETKRTSRLGEPVCIKERSRELISL